MAVNLMPEREVGHAADYCYLSQKSLEKVRALRGFASQIETHRLRTVMAVFIERTPNVGLAAFSRC
jgi:hypothetical protein